MSHLVLVDGSNWLYRAFYKSPNLVTASGQSVGGVHGFAWMLFNLIRHPRIAGFSHIAVTFDKGRENWRHGIDPGYKCRAPSKPEIVGQQALARRCAEVFGLNVVEVAGFEADDTIATYVHKFQSVLDSDPTARATIVSSDKDLMQLVSYRVTMLDTLKKPPLWIGPDEVMAKFGVGPWDVPLLLALAGDEADSIVGLRKVGPVTAATWIKTHRSTERLIASLSPQQRNTVSRNLILVSLRTDAPVPDLDEIAVRNVDMSAVDQFFDELEFRKLKHHVAKSWGIPREAFA